MGLSYLSPIWIFIPICICLFASPHAGMRQHVREGVKKHKTHIELKSYKLDLLEKLVS